MTRNARTRLLGLYTIVVTLLILFLCYSATALVCYATEEWPFSEEEKAATSTASIMAVVSILATLAGLIAISVGFWDLICGKPEGTEADTCIQCGVHFVANASGLGKHFHCKPCAEKFSRWLKKHIAFEYDPDQKEVEA